MAVFGTPYKLLDWIGYKISHPVVGTHLDWIGLDWIELKIIIIKM